jgi:hypothetical protein
MKQETSSAVSLGTSGKRMADIARPVLTVAEGASPQIAVERCVHRARPAVSGGRSRIRTWEDCRPLFFTDRCRYCAELGEHRSKAPLWHAFDMTTRHASRSPLRVRSPGGPAVLILLDSGVRYQGQRKGAQKTQAADSKSGIWCQAFAAARSTH